MLLIPVYDLFDKTSFASEDDSKLSVKIINTFYKLDIKFFFLSQLRLNFGKEYFRKGEQFTEVSDIVLLLPGKISGDLKELNWGK